MHGIQFVSPNTSIDFIGKRFITFVVSLVIILGSLGAVLFNGLNYGIDFRGGILMEVQTEGPADIASLRSKLGDLGLGDVSLQEFGTPRDVLIRVERQPGGEEVQAETVVKVKQKLGSGIDFRRVESVGPTVGAELIQNGIQAVLWAMVAMLIYVWFRFEWQFAVCGILSLLHDAISIIGLYGLTRIEFNTTAIVAVLITVGYSINDTVVVYDRIRENLRKYKAMDIKELINKSINETLSRSVLTSFTTLLALGALYFFGGEVISTYSLPIIVGISVGTYSSICLAAPLLLVFNIKTIRDQAKNKAATA